MSQASPSPASTPQTPTWSAAALVAVLGLAVCAVAISARSFWLDEAVIYKATLPTLAQWWHSICAKGTSEVQQPLYNLFAWAWEKLAGENEFALRAGNALWYVVALTVLTRALAATPLRWAMPLAVLTSPFAWYYLNETRPYTVQFSTSLVVFASLYRLAQSEDPAREGRWVLMVCLSSLLLAASSLLAMLWLGAFLGATVASTPLDRLMRWVKAYWPAWAVTLGLLFLFGLYYLWTLTTGARASPIGTTDLKNVLFLAYELLGFSGLGPGRLAIRAGGVGAFRPWVPFLLAYALVLGPLLVAGWRQTAGLFSRRTRLFWALALALVGAFILATGVQKHFRVLGRHFAAALPVVLLLPAMGLSSLLKRGHRAAHLAVWGFVSLSLVSCAMLRFSERHAKDDYRGAAALARQALARRQTVWWNAGMEGALVYHVPVAESPGGTNGVHLLQNPGPGFERNLPAPDLVLASKPDVFDGSGVVADYLQRHGFQCIATLTAFTVWSPGGKAGLSSAGSGAAAAAMPIDANQR